MKIKTNKFTKEKTFCFTETEFRDMADCIIDTYAFCESERHMVECVLIGEFNEKFAKSVLSDTRQRMTELAVRNNRILKLLDGKSI